MIPVAFQTLGMLRKLNIAAVGLALAATVTSIIGGFFSAVGGKHDVAGLLATEVLLGIACPTFLIGSLWAALLRSKKRFPNSNVRWGWVLSIPLAAINGGLACGFMMLSEEGSFKSFLFGILMGATFGATIWVPALVGTVTFFGIPISFAQRDAERGLAGEEKGEVIVGVTCAVLSLFGLLVSRAAGPWLPAQLWDAVASVGVPGIFGAFGLLTGSTAACLASFRERRRRRFVADVEAGRVEGYRVDETPEVKALVRVVSNGQGYRVADFQETVFELDASGEAKFAIRN